ncbi:MAG: hypothetical protein UZ21_OP11001001025 [Microgenomates bacterium OLB22]|nr:MAG: hypothetical protein UZ21_OP11001001025 [Microgenomates bacterium OLB22]
MRNYVFRGLLFGENGNNLLMKSSTYSLDDFVQIARLLCPHAVVSSNITTRPGKSEVEHKALFSSYHRAGNSNDKAGNIYLFLLDDEIWLSITVQDDAHAILRLYGDDSDELHRRLASIHAAIYSRQRGV